jgi:hypothetical protein
LLGTDLDHVKRLPLVVGHFQGPILTGTKIAVDIAEYLASYHGGLMPSGFLVRKLFTLFIYARAHTMHVEKVSRHNLRWSGWNSCRQRFVDSPLRKPDSMVSANAGAGSSSLIV